MPRKLILLMVLLHSVALTRATDVQVWLTRGDQVSLLEHRPNLTFQAGQGTHATRAHLTPGTTYQTMVGFGAAVTDSSAWLIQNRLNAAQRATLLAQLFSPQSGIGLSYLQVPIGASDFALTAYTYDDRPAGQTDPNLAYFSIAHDQTYIIPTLQQARALNPALQLFAAPWSPPAWMKTSQSLYGGSLVSARHSVYAQYFVRFLQAYAAAGLPIHALAAQNEPLNDSTALPSAGMSTAQQSTFIGHYLGPALAAAGLNTRILCYDHNWDQPDYALTVLGDADARPYTAGTAFHGYGGDVSAQTTVHDAFPDKDIYFTEISGGDWATSFPDNLVWYLHNIVIGAPRNWAKTAIFWNIALDENDGPYLPGGCNGCRGVVTINSTSGNVAFEVEYYALAHASKFVQPGAVRTASESYDGTLETVAYRNPDGTEVVLALNPGDASLWFDVVRNGQYFAYRLPPKSVATFVWPRIVPTGDFDGDGDVDFSDFTALVGTVAASPLTNGGFEDGATGNISAGVPGWGVWGSSGWHHDDAGRVIGTKAIKFWWDDAGVWQDVPVVAGNSYAYRVLALNSTLDPLVGWNGLLKAEFYNSVLGTDSAHRLGEAVVDKFYAATDPRDQWVTLAGAVTAPATADIGRIVLQITDYQSGAHGSLNLDSASVVAAQPGCLTAPDVPGEAGCLAAFDFDGDNDIDLRDIATFQINFTGTP